MPDILQVITSRFALDRERLSFTLRTVAAAVIALYLATALGLEHPNWSVMGVLSGSQPTRERLFLKCSLRAAGSVIGAVAGVLMLLAAGSETVLVLGLLSIWIGLFVAGTVLLRGLFSYFAMVCSFTAAMVVLLVSDQPDSVWALGTDRMLTAFVGVAVAGVIGALFTPRAASSYPAQSLSQALSALFTHLATSHDSRKAEQGLFDLMKIEVTLDAQGDGTPRRGREIRALRRALSAMLALSLHHGRRSRSNSSELDSQLQRMGQQLADSTALADLLPLLHQTIALCEREDAAMAAYLHKLAKELGTLAAPAGWDSEPAPKVYLHHDWPTARLAFIRVVIAFWLLGLFWMLTGWEACAYLIISATVMISVYSSADEPLGPARQSFIGQLIGVVAALLCIALLWPLSSSVWVAAIPICFLLLAGSLVWAHPHRSIVGYDILMSMMLLLNPWLYADLEMAQALPIGIAIFSGPLIVWTLFRTLLPVDTGSKARSMQRMIWHELEAMSRRFGKSSPQRWEIWHARLYLRILRLAQLQHLSNQPLGPVAAEGMGWFDLADSIATLHSLARNADGDPQLHRAAKLALGRMARVERQSGAAARALQRVIRRLPEQSDGREPMLRAAEYLSD